MINPYNLTQLLSAIVGLNEEQRKLLEGINVVLQANNKPLIRYNFTTGSDDREDLKKISVFSNIQTGYVVRFEYRPNYARPETGFLQVVLGDGYPNKITLNGNPAAELLKEFNNLTLKNVWEDDLASVFTNDNFIPTTSSTYANDNTMVR